MFGFKRELAFSIVSILLISSCSSGESTISRPKPKPEIEVSNDTEEKTTDEVTVNQSSPPESKPEFSQPVTEIKENLPKPEIQVSSYEKILNSLNKGEFDFIEAEYIAGGLSIRAQKADNQFSEFPLRAYLSGAIRGLGLIGLNSINASYLGSAEKKVILDTLLKQIFIYSSRKSLKDLVNTHEANLTKTDESTIRFVEEAKTFFFGNKDGTIRDNSIAELAQSIDNNNNLSNSIYNNISNNLNILSNVAKNDENETIKAENIIEKNFLRLLYFATLENLAKFSKDGNKQDSFSPSLTNAEYYFLGLKEQAKTSSPEKNNQLKVMFKRKDLFDYNNAVKIINQGIAEIARKDMEKAISFIEKPETFNLKKASEFALSAQERVSIFNSTYNNVVERKVQNQSINNNLSSFVNAIKSNNLNSANDFLNKFVGEVLIN